MLLSKYGFQALFPSSQTFLKFFSLSILISRQLNIIWDICSHVNPFNAFLMGFQNHVICKTFRNSFLFNSRLLILCQKTSAKMQNPFSTPACLVLTVAWFYHKQHLCTPYPTAGITQGKERDQLTLFDWYVKLKTGCKYSVSCKMVMKQFYKLNKPTIKLCAGCFIVSHMSSFNKASVMIDLAILS